MKDFLTEEGKDELNKTKKVEQEIKRDKKGNKIKDKTDDFQKFKRIRSFGR